MLADSLQPNQSDSPLTHCLPLALAFLPLACLLPRALILFLLCCLPDMFLSLCLLYLSPSRFSALFPLTLLCVSSCPSTSPSFMLLRLRDMLLSAFSNCPFLSFSALFPSTLLCLSLPVRPPHRLICCSVTVICAFCLSLISSA